MIHQGEEIPYPQEGAIYPSALSASWMGKIVAVCNAVLKAKLVPGEVRDVNITPHGLVLTTPDVMPVSSSAHTMLFRGDWDIDANYTIGDVVDLNPTRVSISAGGFYGDIATTRTYVCIQDNGGPAVTPRNPDFWFELTGGCMVFCGQWSNSRDYYTNDVVLAGSGFHSLYIANTDNLNQDPGISNVWDALF